MAEPQNAQDFGAGNGTDPTGSDASSELPERFQGMSAADIAKQFADYEAQTAPAMRAYEDAQRYGGYDQVKEAYINAYNQNQQYAQYLQQLQAQQNMQSPPSQQQSGDDWTSQWDYLSSTEQAQRLNAHVAQQLERQAQQYYQQALQALRQEMQAETATMRNQFDVFRAMLEQQKQNPALDARELLQTTADLAQAPTEQLMALAAQRIHERSGARDAEIKRLAEEQFQKRMATWEQEQRNKELASITDGGSDFFTPFRRDENYKPTSNSIIAQTVRDRLLNGGSSTGLTPAHFIPD